MKDKFELLVKEIENEIYDQALKLQIAHLDNESVNNSYFLGYRAALLSLLGKARNIMRNRLEDEFLPLIYTAAAPDLPYFIKAFEEFAVTGKIKKR